jgi:hypothetical protein
MFIVCLMLGGFAVAFSALVHRADALSERSPASEANCGDSAGTPCPTRTTQQANMM